MIDDFKNCDFCQHYARTQTGPHAWRHDCRLRQVEFPAAEDCAAYQPPPHHQGSGGLGYIWDREFEGAP